MTATPEEIDAITATDLPAFVERSFETLHPGSNFLANWHIQVMIYYLLQVEAGAIRNLIVNVMPRSLKSIFISVIMPAWILMRDPSKKIICISHSDKLANDFSELFRTLIDSDWYQRIAPGMVVKRSTTDKVATSLNGYRMAFSFEGRITGFGGDYVFMDDPLDASLAYSAAQHERVIQVFNTVIANRTTIAAATRFVLVMQRLHMNDLAGHLLATEPDEWTLLKLTAIAEDDELHPIGGGQFYSRRKGELLHPELMPLAELEKKMRRMGSAAYAAQFQQNPVPAEGIILNADWPGTYDKRPDRSKGTIVTSWDPAMTIGPGRSYTVGITIQEADGYYYVLDVFRRQVEFTDAVKAMTVESARHTPHAVLIERASSGLPLENHLKTLGLHAISIKPDRDKESRYRSVMPLFEAGRVLFPKDAPWLADLMRELLSFPNGDSDQVDALGQALTWFETKPKDIFDYEFL